MLAGKRILSVIPARGGSLRVPRKNLRPLAGRPLVAYAIACSKAVSEIELTVVSTDDLEIADIARNAGVRVVNRPVSLATDEARTESALLHALDALEAEGEVFDVVVTLEPTSPLRRPKTVRRCLARFVANDAEALLTVRETRANLGHLADGVFVPLAPDAPRRQQARAPFYEECGAVYICSTKHLRRTGNIFSNPWFAEPVDELEAIDINTEVDFRLAELLIGESRT